MLNFQGTVYIRNGITYSLPLIGGSIFLVNPGSVLIINQQQSSVIDIIIMLIEYRINIIIYERRRVAYVND